MSAITSSRERGPLVARLLGGVVALWLLTPGASGCGDEAGAPQPIPIPGPDVTRVRVSGLETTEPQSVHVVGLPGAVRAAVSLVIEGPAGERVEARATEQGSFSAFVTAGGGATLTLRVVGSDEPAELEVKLGPGGVIVGLEPIDGVPLIDAPSPGKARVRASGPARSELLLVNITSGVIATGAIGDGGTFSIEIGAARGDEVWVYYDAPPTLGAALLQLTAP